MNSIRTILIFIFLHLFVFKVSSQVASLSEEVGSEFNRGMEMFGREKYPAAIRLLDSYVRKSSDRSSVQVTEAEYFSALAALKVFHADAEYRMNHFIAIHPGYHRINDAYMALADYATGTRITGNP